MKRMPVKKDGTRLCIAVTSDGVTVYGNRQAFESLAEQMQWIAQSNSSEHYECHVVMAFENDESRFEGKKPKNVWVLAEKNLAHFPIKESENYTNYELTFMAVEEKDLDEMAKYQEAGLLPNGWTKA